jgi:molybdopterin biosynthesis enzyme
MRYNLSLSRFVSLYVCSIDTEWSIINCARYVNPSQDGFAIQSGDESSVFSVIGEIRAGNVDESIEVRRGGVCYVTTGSPIPKGTDAVVMIEDTATVEGTADEQVSFFSSSFSSSAIFRRISQEHLKKIV